MKLRGKGLTGSCTTEGGLSPLTPLVNLKGSKWGNETLFVSEEIQHEVSGTPLDAPLQKRWNPNLFKPLEAIFSLKESE